MKNGLQVIGQTSAAMILYVGGVGIGIGTGFYGLVLFTYLISLVMAKLGNLVESKRMKAFKKFESKSGIRLDKEILHGEDRAYEA